MAATNGVGNLIDAGATASGALSEFLGGLLLVVFLAVVGVLVGPIRWWRASRRIKSIIRGRRFVFMFNPEGRRRKVVTFNPDGTIGEGRNNNEHTWKIKRGRLDIYGADGLLYSSFRHDVLSGKLIHTNDPNTRSIRNQSFEIMGERAKPPHPLCGMYEAFHLSTAQNGKVISSVVEITSDNTDRLVVAVESFKYRYTGDVIADGKCVTLRLAGDGHEEQMTMIFGEPLSREFDVLLGVYGAVTETFVPACGKILAHKVASRPTCQRIERDQCNRRILNFLTQPDNPIIVPKAEPPLLEELTE